MSQIVLALIAVETAKLTRLVETPTGDLAYGVDLWCVSDIKETLDEVTSESPLGMAQAAIRRLTTPRGGLPDDPDYGLDVRGYLNRGTSTGELRDAAGQIRAEVTKDDRVERATVTVTANTNASELTITIVLTPVNPNVATFSLIIAVTSGAVILEAIS
jgi:hypothetical protein